MASPTRRNARLSAVAAAALGLAISAAVTWRASYSSFSSKTFSPASNWAAGSVALSDDDAGTAMFTAAGLFPASTDTKCIAVTSTGSLPSAVRLYGTAASTTNSLSSYLNLTVTQGTGGGFGTCAGFTPLGVGATLFNGTLAGFASSCTNFAGGLGSWTPTGSGSETRVFQFTYQLDPSAPNSAQSGSASIGFSWEAQNT